MQDVLLSEALAEGAKQATSFLRTLAHESRLLVLCLLIERGEMTVGQLLEEVDLSQSALSQHLAKMRDEGLVDKRRDAQNMYYFIADPNVAKILSSLKEMFCPWDIRSRAIY